MEIKRGRQGESFGERLPWLEPVEEDYEPDQGGGFGKLILLIVVAAAAIGLAIGAFAWWRAARAQQAAIGTVIHAPPGPYKTKPADPGGMEIASAGAVAERTSVGGDINSPLDLAALPEEPITGPGSAEGAPTAVAPQSPPARGEGPPPPAVAEGARNGAPAANGVRPPPILPAIKPAASPTPPPLPHTAAPNGPPPRAGEELKGGAIQLGAFSSDAAARAAWKALAKRFASLGGLSEAILPVPSGDTTLYRLRASGPGAAKVCAQLKVAGETCAIL